MLRSRHLLFRHFNFAIFLYREIRGINVSRKFHVKRYSSFVNIRTNDKSGNAWTGWTRMLPRTGNGGNEHGEREIEKLEQSREFKMKLLIALGLKLGFVSIFHFPVPRYRSRTPFPLLVTSVVL